MPSFRPLTMLTNHLVDLGVFERIVEEGVECGCGSLVLNPNLGRHLLTPKHIQYLQTKHPHRFEYVMELVQNELSGVPNEFTQECDICNEFQMNFYQCRTCRQSHCEDCHDQIEKCPFCRTVFPLPPDEWLFVKSVSLHLQYLSAYTQTDLRNWQFSYRLLAESLDEWEMFYSKPKYRKLLSRVQECLALIESHQEYFFTS